VRTPFGPVAAGQMGRPGGPRRSGTGRRLTKLMFGPLAGSPGEGWKRSTRRARQQRYVSSRLPPVTRPIFWSAEDRPQQDRGLILDVRRCPPLPNSGWWRRAPFQRLAAPTSPFGSLGQFSVLADRFAGCFSARKMVGCPVARPSKQVTPETLSQLCARTDREPAPTDSGNQTQECQLVWRSLARNSVEAISTQQDCKHRGYNCKNQRGQWCFNKMCGPHCREVGPCQWQPL
jgi:hypothetical protein